VKLNVSFLRFAAGALRVVEGRPSTLIGIPRQARGWLWRKDINTLHRWRPSTPTTSTSPNSAAAILSARSPKRSPLKLSRACCIPTITRRKARVAIFPEYFLVACSLAISVRRFALLATTGRHLPDKAAIQLNDTHPTLAVPELMRLLLDEAKLNWDDAWTSRNARWLHESHAAAGSAGDGRCSGFRTAATPSGNHL
jgi:starch phosphorylase